MFPIRDLNSEKESWYIPGILGIKFASFKEALDWLLMFLNWLENQEIFKEIVERLDEFFQDDFFQDVFEKYSNNIKETSIDISR